MAGGSFKERAHRQFDQYMPAHRKYYGLRRRTACLVVVAVVVAMLVLIIGLAAGLSRRSSKHQSLPLRSKTYSGDLTYYGPGLGACGVTSSDVDHIVSISHFVFDAASAGSNPNANPLCGHKLRAVRDGNSIDLTVVDRCVGCKSTDIDSRGDLGVASSDSIFVTETRQEEYETHQVVVHAKSAFLEPPYPHIIGNMPQASRHLSATNDVNQTICRILEAGIPSSSVMGQAAAMGAIS